MVTSVSSRDRELVSVGQLLAVVDQLRPLFEADAQEAEARGALSAEVVEALHDAGFFRLYLPPQFGGAGADPVQIMEVVEAVSYADPSTGWVVFAPSIAMATAAAFLGDAALDQLFGGGRIPVIAGSGIPRGKATPVEGGYRLSGQWSYASGLRHAEYVHATAVVDLGADAAGPPQILAFTLPVDAATLGGNWDVLGLRATGSVDFSITDAFVPEEFTYVAHTTEPLREKTLGKLGSVGVGMIGHTAWALGVGARVRDELAVLATTKPVGVPTKAGQLRVIADSESFQEQFADADARLRAARALAHQTWREIAEVLAGSGSLSTRQNTLFRLSLNHATWTAVDMAEFAYRAGGGVTLRRGVLQRLYRDMHAGCQHITSSTALLRDCGRELVGLADGERWAPLSLVPATP